MQVFAPSEAGGLPRVVEGLAIGHKRAGHDVSVAAICLEGDPETTSFARLRAAGVAIHRVNISARGYLRERRVLEELYRTVRPQVVHTHGARPDVIDGLAAVASGLPTVTTLHGRTGGGLKWRLFEWLQHVAIQRFNAIVAVSRPQVDYLRARGVSANRIHLVPNAWTPVGNFLSREDARRMLDIDGGAPLAGWVGRLSHEKGADVFIESLARVTDPALQASVLGDGSAAGGLKDRARALGLNGRIHWHGTVPDAGRLFRAFDLFVLSSRTEGTPIVLFEAMAAGVPIVATRVGGVPDVVSEADAALVPSDDPAALAAAIGSTLRSPGEAHERAERARARLAAEFGDTAWLRRYEEIYRSAIAAS